MTLRDTTARSQTESLSFDFDLPHPPEKVWRALTDPELLAGWLLPVVGHALEPGAEFAFQAPPKPGWSLMGQRLIDLLAAIDPAEGGRP